MSRPNSQGSQNEGKAQEAAIEKVSLSDEIVIDEATNKRIVRKIDWRLMPIVWSPPSIPTDPFQLPLVSQWLTVAT